MSSDDSQNNFVLDYNDQYDDEEVSESDGLSLGHSDDVQVVDARPVGGRPAKSRPIAPIQSISSKAPPKKKVKSVQGGSSSVVADQTKSTGKCPMEVTEANPHADVHATDPKRAGLAGEGPRLIDDLTKTLACGAFSLPEMFNLLFQMSPLPANFVNEKTDSVAGQVAHHISQAASGTAVLFVRATVDVSHLDQEIRELKEKVRHLEAQVDSLNRYPSSNQFCQDATALYPSRKANLHALVKSFCSSEDVVAPLLQALHQDLISPPGPEPFNDPSAGPTGQSTTNSRSHVPYAFS
nr:uncharacterized protein LOC109149872 [Ipomoea batatas]